MVKGDGGQVDWLEELVNAIRGIHDTVLEVSGGLQGERTALLYGACARPFHTAFGEDVYPDHLAKAAALFHAIICDPCFVDANKRTATIASLHLLVAFGYLPSQPANIYVRLLGEVAIEAALGDLTCDEVIS